MHEPHNDLLESPLPKVARHPYRLSRAQVLALAGAGITMAVLPSVASAAGTAGRLEFPTFPQVQGTYTPEDVRDILNILVTMQRFGVAVNAANLSGPLDPKIIPLQISTQQSSLISNMAQVDFLESLGAVPLTNTLTAGPATPFTAASLKRAEVVLTIFVGAYLTAAREFAELGQPLLVKWAFQAGARLAEERAISRALMAVQNVPDTDPPDNKAFETDLFVYVRDAYALLTRMGLFGGLPVRLPYPSREMAMQLAGSIGARVIQQVPNNAVVSITSPADVTKERL